MASSWEQVVGEVAGGVPESLLMPIDFEFHDVVAGGLGASGLGLGAGSLGLGASGLGAGGLGLGTGGLVASNQGLGTSNQQPGTSNQQPARVWHRVGTLVATDSPVSTWIFCRMGRALYRADRRRGHQC